MPHDRKTVHFLLPAGEYADHAGRLNARHRRNSFEQLLVKSGQLAAILLSMSLPGIFSTYFPSSREIHGHRQARLTRRIPERDSSK